MIFSDQIFLLSNSMSLSPILMHPLRFNNNHQTLINYLMIMFIVCTKKEEYDLIIQQKIFEV